MLRIFGFLVVFAMVIHMAMAGTPLKIYIPADEGGGMDTAARTLASAMQKSNLLPDGADFNNIGGLDSSKTIHEFMKEQGNDNALMMVGAVTIGGLLYNKSPFTMNQVTPLARLASDYQAIAVSANSPIKTMAQLLNEIKKDSGNLTIGGGANGGPDHIMAGFIYKKYNLSTDKMKYFSFSDGGKIIQALNGGAIDFAFTSLSDLRAGEEAGLIRILSVSSKKRLDNLPRVPNYKESDLDTTIEIWRGVVGAPNMSKKGKKQWLKILDATNNGYDWNRTLEKNIWNNAYISGNKFGKFMAKETKKIQAQLQDYDLIK